MKKREKRLKKAIRIANQWPILIIILAIGLVGWGLWLANKAFTDYSYYHKHSVHFDKDSTIQDLGTVLDGSVGSIFTLAGIILLLFTIYQTKAEMVATQNIMAQSLTESTFFNLLKNHKDVILKDAEQPSSDIERFSSEIFTIKNKLKEYIAALERKEFQNFESTAYDPWSLYHSSVSLRAVGESLVHIHNFVEKKLKGDNSFFYQRTFYSNLNKDEKYLLGFIIRNELDILLQTDFLYSGDYLLTLENPERPIMNSFTPIPIEIAKDYKIPALDYSNKSVKEIIDDEALLSLHIDSQIKFKKLEYLLVKPNSGVHLLKQNRNKGILEITNDIDAFNIFKLIAEPALKDLAEVKKINVFLTYHFEFSKQEFKIHQQFQISRSNYISVAFGQAPIDTSTLSKVSTGYDLKIEPITQDNI